VAKNLILVALAFVALVVIGSFVLSVLGGILKIALYLLVGLAVVGGALYVVGKARGAIRGGRFKQLP
jgi:hypothetical protein